MKITPAEARIIPLVVEGKSDKQIARELHKSPRTIQSQLYVLYRKLNVTGRQELRLLLPSAERTNTDR